MFERILSLFAPVSSYRTPLPEADMQHVLGALLVKVAHADRAYLFQEVERIDRILAHRFDLNPLEAAKMRARCERLLDEMPDTADLLHILHDATDKAERETSLRALWQVVYADGQRHQAEDQVVTLAQKLLGIDPETCARLRAEALDAASAG